MFLVVPSTQHNRTLPIRRFQLKRGLLWYKHSPKIHEMLSDGSSRADLRKGLPEISMRVFLNSENEKNDMVVQRNTNLLICLTTNL